MVARTKKFELLEVLGRVSPILPPRGPAGPFTQATIRLPKPLLELIERIAEEEGYSRNEVVQHFLQYAITEFQRERAEPAEGRAPLESPVSDAAGHRKPKK
jgi:hypothetical protein